MVTPQIVLSLFGAFTFAAGCTFPTDLTGETTNIWTHSFHGTITFTANDAFTISIEGFGDTTATCDTVLTADSRYIVKSNAVTLTINSVTTAYYASICITFEKISSTLYQITHETAEMASAGYSRIYVAAQGLVDAGVVTLNEATVCNDAGAEYFLLMKQGEIANTKVNCPSSIQGTLSYTIDGDSTCTNDAGRADICTDATLVDFDYTKCATEMAYSSNGEVNCIYNTTSGSTTTVWTWNTDTTVNDNTTFRFACFMIQVDSSGSLTGTQNFRFCHRNQTYNTIPTGGTSITNTAPKKVTGTVAACSGTETLIGQRSTILWIMMAVLYQMS